MPSRRELERESERSRQRVSDLRNAQTNGGDGPRGSGNLLTPGAYDEDNPVPVDVISGRDGFYSGLVRAFKDAYHGDTQRVGGQRGKYEDVDLKSFQAMQTAASQIAYEMSATVQMVRDQRSGLDTSLDGLQDAIDDFVNQQKGRQPQTGGAPPGAGPPPPPVPPAGSPGPGGPTGGTPNTPQGPSGAPRRPMGPLDPYAATMRGIDPTGRLGGHIFGGPDYWGMLARGQDPNRSNVFGHSHPSGMHELRGALGAQLGRAIHNRYGLGQDDQPRLTPNMDDQGNLQNYSFNDGSGVTETIDPGDSSRLQAAHAAVTGAMVGRRLTASRLGTAIAGGAARGGVMGAVGAAGRVVPGVGYALTAAQAANEIGEFATEQRSKNAYYQSIYGGSNASGFLDRLGEEATVLGNRFSFGMDEQMSRQAFKDVSQLGYDGAQRDNYVGFIGQQYNRTGMNEQQSMGVLAAATRNANEGLIGVSKALDGVTKRARSMGTNVSQMTDAFVRNYSTVAELGFGGSSGSLAAALTNNSVGMGAGMEGSSWAGAFTPSNMRIMAGQAGMNLNQYMYQSRKDPNFAPRQLDQRINQTLGGALGQGNWRQQVQNLINQRGGPQALKGNKQLAREIWHQAQGIPGAPDPEVLQQLIESAGGSVADIDDAGVQAIGQIADPSRMENESRANQEAAKARPLTEEEKAARNEFSSTTIGRELTTGERFGKVFDRIGTLFGGEMDAIDTANDLENETGMKNPVFDSLIQTTENNDNVGVKVQTAKGEKVVSMSTAMRDYGDQVSRGTATLVGGEHDGQAIKDVEGITVDQTAQGDSTKKDPGDEGVDEKKWKEDHPDDGSSGTGEDSGAVTLDLTDEAKRLVKQLDPSGERDTENAARIGTTPQPGVPQFTN